MVATNGMLDPDDSIILLIDHQSGLFNTVRDVPVPDLRNYVIAIAKAAKDAMPSEEDPLLRDIGSIVSTSS